MKRLTAYQTHKLIKKDIPEATTEFEKTSDNRQMTFDEWMPIKFAMEEEQLQQDAPEMFQCLMANIERR